MTPDAKEAGDFVIGVEEHDKASVQAPVTVTPVDALYLYVFLQYEFDANGQSDLMNVLGVVAVVIVLY